MLLMTPISLVLGTAAALRRGRMLDHIVSVATLSAIAFPEFVTGTILAVVFAVSLRLLPADSLVAPGESPLATPSVLVLPVVTLLFASLAFAVRMVRAGVGGVMQSDYVAMARLNGIPEARLIWRHVLPNALAPTVQVLALTLQWLIGGIVVTETVFQYPGLGQGLVQAVIARDIPVVQAISMLIAVIYIGINIVADVAVILLIPKLRTAR
jgi:peptide/nickel transport system permease protein